MEILDHGQKAGADGCTFYKESSYSNVLGSSIFAFHFKTNQPLELQVNYSDSFYKMVLCLNGFSKSYQKNNHVYSFVSGKALLYKTNTETYLSQIKSDTEYNLIHLHFSHTLVEEMKQLHTDIFKENSMEVAMVRSQLELFKDMNGFNDLHPALANMLVEKTMLDQLYAFTDTRLKCMNQQRLRTGADRDKIYEAKELLDQSNHYISIECLAKHVGMNTFKLKKIFKEEFNKPVFEYQVDIHFSKAYMLLLDTFDSIQDIALSCGYQSAGSFSNAFKRKFGMRPSDLRKY